MKLSSRLQTCADLVRRGSVAVDVGTDHGYLALYLLEQGICPRVIAADVREGPLNAARRSAQAEGVRNGITFVLSDGLGQIDMTGVQTVICAGMGGETIQGILDREPAVQSADIQLILQPQSKTPELRRYLAEHGFAVEQEVLARDGQFLYAVMEARFDGRVRSLTPGEQILPECLREDPLLPDYISRLRSSIERTIDGLRMAASPEPGALAWYEAALAALEEGEESS